MIAAPEIDISTLPNPIDHPEQFITLIPASSDWLVIISRLIAKVTKDRPKLAGDAYTMAHAESAFGCYKLRLEVFTPAIVAGAIGSTADAVGKVKEILLTAEALPQKGWQTPTVDYASMDF